MVDFEPIGRRFRVVPGSTTILRDRDPTDVSSFPDRDEAERLTTLDAAEIDALQNRLFADRRHALLVVLQGVDTSGKDGTIRGVFNATGPLGVSVTGFGVPTPTELAHDYLWRVHGACPRRGTIGIFNRSHYEDVLVVKVRSLAPADAVETRYDDINAFEKMLANNGTVILKFMLHLSKDEQKERLQERLTEPDKQWKFNPNDLDDRRLWADYEEAYEIMLSRCSTEWAPWFVIPADRKWARNAAIAGIVRQTLEAIAPRYPAPDWKPADFEIR